MGKLVRDRIPEIIEADGKTPVIRILDDEIYEMELYIKLTEEIKEFLEAFDTESVTEELADIMEVIMALCKLHGIDINKVEEVRKKKALERGSFDKKIFLQFVK